MKTYTVSRRDVLALAGAGIAGAMVGPGQASAATDSITAVLASDLPTLDPSVSIAPPIQHVRLNVFDALTEIGADAGIKPALATAWEASADFKTWVLTLRPNVKFHNGQPLTADDVVWTFQKVMDDKTSALRTFIAMIEKVDTTADGKIRFQLSAPNTLILRPISLVSILPKEAYTAAGAARFGVAPIGTGPYRLIRWLKDDRIEMEAFDGYWGGAPKVKRATLRPVPAEANRAAALISGEADIVPEMPIAMIDRFASRSGLQVGKAPGHRVVYLGFNVFDPVLSDLKLRQAIDYAIDRNVLISKLLNGIGSPASHIVAPSVHGHDAKLPPTGYDVAKAKAVLAESSYKGQRIPFHFPNNNIASGTLIVEAIAGFLSAVGINVEVVSMDYNGFFPLWTSKKLPGMHMFANGPAMMDADSPLTALYQTGSRGFWSTPEMDALIARQRLETDPAKRQATLSEIYRVGQAAMPYVFLFNEWQAYAMRRGVEWTPRPDGKMRFFELTATS